VNGRQRKTLTAVFADPVSPAVAWASIENLLLALGCELVEGSGSRVRFAKDGMIESFHRSHPAKEAKKYQVLAARSYLSRLGVEP
jgi:hypothetical protein